MALKRKDNCVVVPTGNKDQDRENLRNIIAQWNANRLDLFELSEPNENLEFHGVMRFYFQDAGQKVATKCIRVSSTATSQVIIETLIEKFRPDMRMLSIFTYSLYEIHVNGEERKLGDEEKPLLVQLNWHKDDREGRFLLKREDDTSQLCDSFDSEQYMENFKRKLSKREKKELKKKEKKDRALRGVDLNKKEDGTNIAEKLYSELPETGFTRSISNPEAVMRRRRQQILEKKLQQFRNEEGGPDSGGTLKVYGESLKPDVPYKTLLLSVSDTVPFVIKETLEKYGMETEDPNNYIIVQILQPLGDNGQSKEYHGSVGTREYVLEDEDCPLSIISNHPSSRGIITFHIQRKPSNYQPRKRKKKTKSSGDMDPRYNQLDFQELQDRLPCLVEVNSDGSELPIQRAKQHKLQLNVTEVGCERSMSLCGQYLQLFGPNVMPRHCVIAHTEGIVTVTPCSRDAETYVNNQRIYETTILQHGMLVRFGKTHTFCFCESSIEELRIPSIKRQVSDAGSQPVSEIYSSRPISREEVRSKQGNFETTFDVDGHIETVTTKPQMLKSLDERLIRRCDDHPPEYSPQNPVTYEHKYPILPATLEFKEEGEDTFLSSIINSVQASQVHFKLAPTYTIYLSARYRSSTQYRPDCLPAERAYRLTTLLTKVASRIQQTIQTHYTNSGELAFWMANSSELLHFLKHDRHMSPYCIDAQDILAESVQIAFRYLVQCIQNELTGVMPTFLSERDDLNEEEGVSADVLHVLFSTMSLLRRCRANAALTIQLFSQLFHFINMWLFNRLVNNSRHNYCSRVWGNRLKHRLSRIEAWAEKQGLELAADCHLNRIIQAAHLLQSVRSNTDDLSYITDECFKLNSIQLRALLEHYQAGPDESRIPPEIIANVVRVAENTADELARSDGRDIKLDEDADLQLPFLLPEDGYSCDIVRGFPSGLQEFLESLCQQGLCRLTIQPMSNGLWTVYMSSDQDSIKTSSERNSTHGGPPLDTARLTSLPKEPEIVTVTFKKGNNGMGLSIVAAKGVGCDKLGIYIKSVVKAGAADLDGRLQAGDQLFKVDGQSLVGITQEKAAEFMTRTGPIVTLEVAKQGAIYHGLATLLNQPSPVMQRARKPRPRSEELLSRYNKESGDHFSFCTREEKTSFNSRSSPAIHTLNFPSKPLSRSEAHRLSERDLLSKTYMDQTDDLRACSDADTFLTPSRMQNSKSVPSLNSRSHSQERLRAPSTGNLKNMGTYSSYRSTASSVMKSPEPQANTTRSHSTTSLKQDPMYRQMEINQPTETAEPAYRLMEVINSTDSGYYPMKPVANVNYTGRSSTDNSFPNSRGNESIHTSFQATDQLNHSSQHLSDSSSLLSNVTYPNNAIRTAEKQDPGYSSCRQADIIRQIDFGQRNLENRSGNKENTAPPVLPKSSSVVKNRPISQPNMPREERHYQNIKIYQQPNNVPVSHQNIVSTYQTTKPIPQNPQLFYGNYQNMPASNNIIPTSSSSSSASSAPKADRPMSTIVSQRDQIEYDQRPGNNSELNSEHHMGHSDRVLLRQEAKMDEMREELRRREERGREYQQAQSLLWSPHHPSGYPQYSSLQGQPLLNPNSSINNRTIDSQQTWMPSHIVDQRFFDNRPPVAVKPQIPAIKMQHQTLATSQTSEGRTIQWQDNANSDQKLSSKTETSDLPPPPNIPPERPPPLEELQLYGTRESPPLPPPPVSVTDSTLGHNMPERSRPSATPSAEDRPNPRYGPSGYPPPPSVHERPPSSSHYETLVPTLLSPSSDPHRIQYEYSPSHFSFHSTTPSGYERMQLINFDPKAALIRQDTKSPYDNTNHPEMDASRHSLLQYKNLMTIVTPPGPPVSPSPWEREEREKLRQRMIDEARRLRDQEIASLQNRSYLTSQEEDRLRALRLEQEFQRRAEEVSAHDDEDEDESGSDIISEHSNIPNKAFLVGEGYQSQLQAGQKVSSVKEDNSRHDRRLKQYEQERERERQLILQRLQKKEQNELLRKQAEIREQQKREIEEQKILQEQEERHRQYRLEEERRKREQERQAVREMNRDRNEDKIVQSNYKISADNISNHSYNAYLMLPTNVDHKIQEISGNYSGPPYSSIKGSTSSSRESSTQPSKRVSFHDHKVESHHVTFDNEIINELPEDSWNSDNPSYCAAITTSSPYQASNSILSIANSLSHGDTETVEYNENILVSPQNSLGMSKLTVAPTPGVIGSQEVYRDPRDRIEATRQHTNKKPQGPEKLTFREKMKMFAEEVGEKESPKEKARTSRAQREIETSINGK